ncbi:type VI secretion system baseplate subunit TssE [Neisseria canis]|uniref:Type VI secretion system lysozyme-like protein n=1 Tax=Neisseria canis TaxID=493 RepID=A0A448D759_9NEIS|nr:type VI secretion system baseplate subunit TssE [Neisseria canis]OSI10011.1 type VI secretion protein [Neisseria canis]VEF00412.1 type VI secretion system lysozyme-like protein [Neisseria canis]
MSPFRNQLLPSLFDRLTDEEPRKKKEARPDQAINLDQYRQAVLRDILYLLNTCNLQAETMEQHLPANVRSSTLNYGIPPLSGVNFSDIEWQDVEQNIKQAVIDFEPRLDSKSLQVIVNTEDDDDDALHNKLIIEIKGHLKLNPYPKEFLLRTSMDIETGLFNLLEGGTGRE